MNIIIHGTKGGYKVLYSTLNHSIIAGDSRSAASSESAVGKSAYSIAFVASGCVLTKYVIIRDMMRSMSTGNIAFSIYLLNNQKLSGKDAQSLLDDLADYYCRQYIVHDNLDNVREDWNFVSDIVKKFTAKYISAEDVENFTQGTGEAAFVYYDTEEDLHKYFDAPYQEEYMPFKQVFFVKSDLKEKAENPLNALRHNPSSNLTGRIDLDNPPYKLKEFHGSGKNGITIEIWANDRKRSNKDIINKKDNIRIKYSKGRYYIPIEKNGKLTDIDISHYLNIVDENKITVKIDVELRKKEQKNLVEVKDRSGKEITDAEITCKNSRSNEVKKVINNQITFEGEEIKDTWTVSAISGDLIAKSTSFVPENAGTTITLILEKHKKVSFQVTNIHDGALIYGYNIQIPNKTTKPGETEIEFVGDEIEETWNVSVSYRDYETVSFRYCPAKDENPIYVKLRRKQSPGVIVSNYPVSAGEHNVSKNEGTIIAQYSKKKRWYTKTPFIVAIITIAILIGLYFIFFSGKSNNPGISEISDAQIVQYVEGTELKEDSLIIFQTKYCLSNPGSNKKTILQKIISSFGSKNEDKSTNSTTTSLGYCQQIENALDIRAAINKGNLDELRIKQYYPDQILFVQAVNGVGDEFENEISQIMRAHHQISTMNLNQVADFIIKLQRLLTIREEVKISTDKELLKYRISEIEAMNFPVDNIKTNIIKEINEKIKTNSQSESGSSSGDNPKEEPKRGPKPDPPKPPAKSSLETKFWNLVHSGNPKKDDYTNLLNEYKSKYKESDIIKFLQKICKDSPTFGKFKNKIESIDAIDLSEINTLTKIDIQ